MKKILLALLTLATIYIILPEQKQTPGNLTTSTRQNTDTSADETKIITAYQQQQSNIPVQGHGIIIKILPDDNHGSRHQRFILRLASGHKLLIAHNIDLAPKIPDIHTGDLVYFKGEYEWNDKGGIIHWTHHDPKGHHPHGWLEHNNHRYE